MAWHLLLLGESRPGHFALHGARATNSNVGGRDRVGRLQPRTLRAGARHLRPGKPPRAPHLLGLAGNSCRSNDRRHRRNFAAAALGAAAFTLCAGHMLQADVVHLRIFRHRSVRGLLALDQTTGPHENRGPCVCALWGLLEAAFNLGQVIFGRDSWNGPIQTWWSISILIVIVALVGYIFQDQRATADQRAQLGGELAAARQVQHMLMPQELDVAPGMSLSAAFLPASEVGGDFYRCRVLKDGSQRVLLGDVSGKGVAAALTSALLLGAADRCDDLPPASVLKVLNLALRQSAIGGFTTCLCADVSPTGGLRIANAGHLSPYRNGEELPLSNGLPLGLVDRIDYPQTPLHLALGDTLMFLSDGVVEARNGSRELFGFERTRQMSAHSAQELAEAARQFGQEDDITVLTLTLTGAAVPAKVLV
jgi:hypothetical protein